MRRLPLEVEEAILNRLLEGATYREIQREFGVSLATINRVAEDARKRMPDFDQLRQLSTLLKKNHSNIFDAIRGAALLESLNKFDVSLEKLDHYLKLTERLFSDEVLDNKILEYAIRLLQLEETCGKTYEEIVKEFEIKSSEVKELKSEKEVLEEQNRVLKRDGEKAKKELDALISEIQRTVATQNRLRDVGIEKLNALAKFIQEFEFLGYNVDEVRELARLKQRLRKNKIDPGKLEEYLEQKTSLDSHIHNLQTTRIGLQNQVNRIDENRSRLLAVTSVLSLVNEILETQSIIVSCQVCGVPFRLPLGNREHYQALIKNGLWENITCPSRGCLNQFPPQEIIFHLGWQIVPP